MKVQKVSVDFWAMAKSMIGYVGLAIIGGIFLKLVIAAVTLPKRLRQQRENVQRAMDDLKLKYPDVFKEVEEEMQLKDKGQGDENTATEVDDPPVEDKKTN